MATGGQDVSRKSRLYAVGQTLLIVVFAAAYFLDVGAMPAPPAWLAIGGDVVCILGLLLMAAGVASLRSAIQVAPEPKAGAHLVTSGVYRYLRHPMYTGILAIVIGLLARHPSLGAVLAGAVLVAFLLVKTRFEESLLVARYAGYADYRGRSWGVIPGLRL